MNDSEKKKTKTESYCVENRVTDGSQSSSDFVCDSPGKVVHKTVTEARRHVLKMSARGRKPFGSFYWCEACHGYHVTSNPPKGKFRRLMR